MTHWTHATFATGFVGCNTTALWNTDTHEAVIIDAGDHAPTIFEFIKKNQLQLKLLLHTHAHFDHIAASHEIKKATGAQMALHPDDLPVYQAIQEQGRWFGLTLPPHGDVDINLYNEQTIECSDLRLLVLHTPGHTPGGVSFYTQSLLAPRVFAGDTLFAGSVGRTDLPGGDFGILERSIRERLYTLPDETFVTAGHGPDTSIGEEKKNNPFVRA